MKKLVSVLVCLVISLSFTACGNNGKAPSLEGAKNDHISVPDVGSDEKATELSKITEEEAIEIASKHWGIKSGDKDEKTGFPFLIMPVDSSNDNIKIALKWLVNNQNYSTVDMVEIDSDTGKIVNVDTEE